MKKSLKILKNICLFIVSIAVFAFFSVGCSISSIEKNPALPPQEESQQPTNEPPQSDDNQISNDKSDESSTLPVNSTSYEIWQYKNLSKLYNGSYIDYINEFNVDDEIATATTTTLSSILELRTNKNTGGAGIIFDIDENNNAFIITNYHVVYDKTKDNEICKNNNILPIYDLITAKFYDSNEKFSLEFIGGSSTYDIAVLYAKNVELLETKNAKPATFNLKNIEINSTCLAIGNPNLEGTKVTKGKIVNFNEKYKMTVAKNTTEIRLIYHNANIEHGNSGGGLFNSSGELIGITNGAADNETKKLAIPASVVYSATKNIIANCFEKENTSIIECSLGLTFSSKTEISTNQTKIIVKTFNSEIWTNIQAGDQLISFEITTPDETILVNVTYDYEINDYKILLTSGSTIKMTLKRDGQTENIETSATYDELSTQKIA